MTSFVKIAVVLAVLRSAIGAPEVPPTIVIGVLIFLPFQVVDLVVANILMALGLTAMSVTAVALPFKLLLFVLVDGWRLVVRGLVLGYA